MTDDRAAPRRRRPNVTADSYTPDQIRRIVDLLKNLARNQNSDERRRQIDDGVRVIRCLQKRIAELEAKATP